MSTTVTPGVATALTIDGTLANTGGNDVGIWTSGGVLLGSSSTSGGGSFVDTNGQTWVATYNVGVGNPYGFIVTAPTYYAGQSGFTMRVTETGNNSASFNVAGLPSAPSAPSYGTQTDVNVPVIIQALAGGATSYNLQRAPDVAGSPGVWATVATSVTPSATYNDNTIVGNTGYHYRLVAVNGSGSTNGADAGLIMTAPAFPTGVSTTPNAAGTAVTIGWSASTGAMTYNVYRATSSGGAYSLLAAGTGVAGVSLSDTTVVDGTSYWYKVTAINAAAVASSQSPAAGPAEPVSAPTSLTATHGDTQVALSWVAPAGTGLTYNVYQGIISGGESSTPVATGISGTSTTITALTNGTQYYFKVAAVATAVVGPQSGEATATPEPAVPGTPTGISAVGGVGITVTASTAVRAAFYRLYRATSSGNVYDFIQSSATPNFIDDSVPTGVTFFYMMSAANGGGEGALSTSASAAATGGTMAQERSEVLVGIQIGAETTPGTAVPANIKLLSVKGEFTPMTKNKAWRPRGVKGNTAVQRGKQWSEIKLSGILTYDELIYLTTGLCSVPASGQPTTVGTTAKQWALAATAEANDTCQTFTIEYGSSQGASRLVYCFFNELDIKIADGEASFTATIIGRKVIDSITITASPTELGNVAIEPTDIGVYYGTSTGALALMPKLQEFELTLKNRWVAAFFRDPTNPSYSSIVEGTPDVGCKMTVEEDSQAADLLVRMNAQTLTYFSLQAVGPQITATGGVGNGPVWYSFAMTVPQYITKPGGRTGKDSIWVGTYESEIAHNASFGLLAVTHINTQSTL